MCACGNGPSIPRWTSRSECWTGAYEPQGTLRGFMCPLWVHLAFATGGLASPFLRWEEGQPQMPEELEGLLMEFRADGPTDSPLDMSPWRQESSWGQLCGPNRPGSLLVWSGGWAECTCRAFAATLVVSLLPRADHRASWLTSVRMTEGGESLKLYGHCSHPGCRSSQMCLPVAWWCYSRKEGLEFDRICWDFQGLKSIHLFLPVNRLSNDNLEVHT